MRLDKLTIKAQEALQAAQQRAEALGSPQIEPEHILAALLGQEDGIVGPLLKKLGVSTQALQADLERHLASQPRVDGAQLSISPSLDAVLRQAAKEADQFKDEYVSTEHILLSLAASDGYAGKLLRQRSTAWCRWPPASSEHAGPESYAAVSRRRRHPPPQI